MSRNILSLMGDAIWHAKNDRKEIEMSEDKSETLGRCENAVMADPRRWAGHEGQHKYKPDCMRWTPLPSSEGTVKSEDWYQIIEPEIRPLVRLLRENGWNTTCSCGHKMTVELDLGNNLDDAERLARFLQENGHPEFRIEATLFAPRDGMWIRRATVHIGDYIPSEAGILMSGDSLNKSGGNFNAALKSETVPTGEDVKRYWNDPKFHALVDSFRSQLISKDILITATDLQSALSMAIKMHESDKAKSRRDYANQT